MILHTALHGVETNDNPLNISVGYISAESSGFSRTVSDWSESEGNDTALVVSTMPMPVESVSSHGWVRPIYLDNQVAFQDDPGDKMTASWWYNLTMEEHQSSPSPWTLMMAWISTYSSSETETETGFSPREKKS